MRRRALLALLAAAGGCGAPPDEPVGRLVVAAGGAGEVYEAIGTALVAEARARRSPEAVLLTTTGAVENLQLVGDDRAVLGFATVDMVELARGGEAPFRRALPVVALAGLYDDYLHVVTRAELRIGSLADLRGRRVGTGTAGSAAEVVAGRTLEYSGLGPGRDIERHRLSVADAADAMRRGTLDGFAFTGGLPTPVIDRLAQRVPVRLLPVGGTVADLLAGFGEYYVSRSVPAGTYGIGEEVPTLGVRNVIAVHRDLADETAYRLTALLFGARARLAAAHHTGRQLDRRSALATFPVPLHPGAHRYYRKAKPMA